MPDNFLQYMEQFRPGGEGKGGRAAPTEEPYLSWWQKPFAWAYDKPVLGHALKGMEFIEEKVGKPWYAALTAPFSPSIPGTEGMGWLEREKAEYEAWQSPKFVKGITELTNPVYFIPIGGAVGLAGKALGGVGLKGLGRGVTAAGKGITAMETLPARAVGKTLKAVKPTAGLLGMKPRRGVPEVSMAGREISTFSEKLAEIKGADYVKLQRPLLQHLQTEFPRDVEQRALQWAARNPAGRKIAGLIDRAALADTDMKKMLIGHVHQKVEAESLANAATAELRAMEAHKLFGYGADMRATLVTPKEPGASLAINDILRNPSRYKLDPAQEAYVELFHKVKDEMMGIRKELGLRTGRLLEDELYAPRSAAGRRMAEFPSGERVPLAEGAPVPPGAKEVTRLKGRMINKPQFYKTQEEGLRHGVIYDTPTESLERWLRESHFEIAEKELQEHVDAMARAAGYKLTPLERMDQELREATKAAGLKVSQGKKIQRAVQDAVQQKKLAGATLAMIEREMPDIAKRLRETLTMPIPKLSRALKAINKETWDRLATAEAGWKQVGKEGVEAVGRMGKEAAQVTRMSKDNFMEAVKAAQAKRLAGKGVTPEIKLSDITSAIKQMNLSNEQSLKLLTEIYENAGEWQIGRMPRLKPIKEMSLEQQKAARAAERQARKAQLEALKGIRDDVVSRVEAAKKELGPLAREFQYQKQLASLPEGWETRVIRGGFSSKIYPAEIGDAINQMFREQMAPDFLKKLEKGVAVSRTMMSAMDFGVTQIHLLPLAFRNPAAWARAFKAQFDMFIHPIKYQQWQAANREVISEMSQYGIQVGTRAAEMVEALGEGGILQKIPTLGRFETSFSGALSVGKVETWKALRKLAVGADGLLDPVKASEVASYVRAMTGTLDSRLLGIPAGQRAAEAAFIAFAPRYTRSLFALWKYALTPGMMRKEALMTLGSMAAGATGLYVAACMALGQEPQLNPTKGGFMTVRVGNTNVGIGSGQLAMVKFMANLAGTALTSPEDFLKINPREIDMWRDNPFAKFVRGRLSPLSGAATDIISGRTFLGEPIDNVPTFLKEEVLRRGVPFWLSSSLLEGDSLTAGVIPPELMGLRAYEKTHWQHRDQLREEYAKETFGAGWESLNMLQRRQLEELYPDLAKAAKDAEERAALTGGVKQQTWYSWKDEMAQVNDSTAAELRKADAAVRAGKMTLKEFREKSGEIYAQARAMRDHINSQPRYKSVMEFFDAPLDKSNMHLEDIAYAEYCDLLYSDDLTDEFGLYQYDEAERRRQAIRQKYGPEVYQYIQERLAIGKDEPPAMRALREAREILKPYWEIEDEVWSQYSPDIRAAAEGLRRYRTAAEERQALMRLPEGWPQIIIRNRLIIARRKKMMRMMRPEVQAALDMFYY